MGLRYVMVTHFPNHWDHIPNNETYYGIHMLKGGMSKDKLRNWTPTIFIKRNGRAQRAWKGSVYDIRHEEKEGRIYFKVEIDRETQRSARVCGISDRLVLRRR